MPFGFLNPAALPVPSAASPETSDPVPASVDTTPVVTTTALTALLCLSPTYTVLLSVDTATAVGSSIFAALFAPFTYPPLPVPAKSWTADDCENAVCMQVSKVAMAEGLVRPLHSSILRTA